jgi:hypothetical protein
VAFSLRKDEPIGKGLHRVVRKQLENAIDELGDTSPQSIHNARRNLKKARAVLDLIGTGRPSDRAVKAMRRAGRALSPVRDAEAVIESAKALCAQAQYALTGEQCVALSAGLKSEKRQSDDAADIPQLKKNVRKNLGGAAKSVERMNWKPLRFRHVSDELRHGYKVARRDMRRARKTGRAEDFHAWRKSVKGLLYGLRLLEQRADVNQQVRDLRTLETLLGDDHNLVVLDLAVNRNRTSGAITEIAPQLTRLSKARRGQLRKEALALGHRLLSRRPKRFERRLDRLWTASQSAAQQADHLIATEK